MKERLLFLGPPGAGKGTQANEISKKFNLLHLSTGDLLRAEVKAGSPLGKEAKAIMDKGELVSDEIVLSIVEKKIMTQHGGWLLDGFPRNVTQAESLNKLLSRINQPIQVVILFELDDKALMNRLLKRGRSDDNQETIRHRLNIYREKTTPLVEHYFKLGILKSVEAHGDVAVIAKKIEEHLK
tara:strand:+ start:660 stop:1208 length:549 start_codon:yes stop_codon:yes gene_type:complete